MADDKPCISEVYESGGLDMDLVGKIAHNELDKRKALLPNSDHALASEYIDFYIDVDKSAHEYGHKCIENACAQGIAIASGQAEMPAGGRVSAVEIDIDGSSLGLEPAKDGLERSLDDLCDEKQAEADLVEGNEDRETRFESKETGR